MKIFQSDKDGFQIPAYIPLSIWNQYLSTIENHYNTTIVRKRKIAWIRLLSQLYKNKQNLAEIIRESTQNKWLSFYSYKG